MLTLSIIVLAIGTLLLILALRGRVVERGAFCHRCRFDLCGLDRQEPSLRCPECGRDLSGHKSTRATLRTRRPVLLACGAVLLFIGLASVGVSATNNTARVLAVMPDRVVLTLHSAGMDEAFTEITTNRLARFPPMSDRTWSRCVQVTVAV